MRAGVAFAHRAATPAAALLVALGNWRDVNILPVDSLDPSWQAALHMAAHRHMPGLVFTYGPLGFLAQGVAYYRWTVFLSGLYLLAVGILLGAALVSVLRRAIGLPAAAVAAFVLVSATRDLGVTDLVVVAAVVAAFGLLRGDHSPRTERILVVAGGLVAGTHLLVKFNAGVTVTIVGAVAAWFVGRRGWRSELIFLGTALGSLLAGFLLTGNSVAGLLTFLVRSMQVASGYSQAMGIETEGREVYYPVAVGLTAVLIVLAWAGSRGWSWDRRVGLGLIGAMWLYAGFKLGFVRHDGHDVAFFGEALVVGAALAGALVAAVPEAVVRTWARRAFAAAGTVALVVALLAASKLDVGRIVNPGPALARVGDDVPLLVSPRKMERAITAGRANLQRRYYKLPPPVLAALKGRTVHIHPWEAGIAWAYPELRWRPLPVFQEYTAYTADLDRLNADFLKGPRAPERILTQRISIDLRNPDWESPAVTVALACHYREEVAGGTWQVLRRVVNRCGPEQTLVVVKARVGDSVPVPGTQNRDAMVIARVSGLDNSFLYGLRSTLWRAPEVHAHLDGRRRWRIVPGTAANGLLVRAPPKLGFSDPFAFESATFLRISQQEGIGLSSYLSIEFVTIPVLN